MDYKRETNLDWAQEMSETDIEEMGDNPSFRNKLEHLVTYGVYDKLVTDRDMIIRPVVGAVLETVQLTTEVSWNFTKRLAKRIRIIKDETPKQ